MVNIKRQKIRAYILLESLIAISLFSFVVSLVLTSIEASRRQSADLIARQEGYQLAKMALQTKKDELKLNGQQVTVLRAEEGIAVYAEGELLFQISETED